MTSIDLCVNLCNLWLIDILTCPYVKLAKASIWGNLKRAKL